MNERQVIKQLRNRNTQALKLVYDKYRTAFINWAGAKYSNVGRVVIEDVYSEAILDFYENVVKDKYRRQSSLKTYIFTLGRNKLVNIIKKRIVHQTKEPEIIIETENRAIMNPEGAHFISENAKIVKELMNELCNDCREVLTLFYFHELSMSKIAEKMGYKNANVAKSKKNVCFKKLAKLVQKKYTKADFFEN